MEQLTIKIRFFFCLDNDSYQEIPLKTVITVETMFRNALKFITIAYLSSQVIATIFTPFNGKIIFNFINKF